MIGNIALIVVYTMKKQNNVINYRIAELSFGPKKISSKLKFGEDILETINN